MSAAEKIAAGLTKAQQEHQWRLEERQEWDAELAAINAHRPDCVCRSVHDWSPGPACYRAALSEPMP